MTFEVDPISAASPDMDGSDFAALKQSISEIGQLVPIVVSGGKIVDGRKRYRACGELGKEPAVIELSADADPRAHALALNILRTHYTASQRGMYAEATATATNGGDRVSDQYAKMRTATCTVKQAAAAFGVSTREIDAARVIRRKGVPELAAAVNKGRKQKLSLDGAPEAA